MIKKTECKMIIIKRIFDPDEIDTDAMDQVFTDFNDGQLCRNFLWSWFMSRAIMWSNLAHAINRSAHEMDIRSLTPLEKRLTSLETKLEKIDRDYQGKARI